jgi:hypothetical protein
MAGKGKKNMLSAIEHHVVGSATTAVVAGTTPSLTERRNEDGSMCGRMQAVIHPRPHSHASHPHPAPRSSDCSCWRTAHHVLPAAPTPSRMGTRQLTHAGRGYAGLRTLGSHLPSASSLTCVATMS